VWPAGVCGRDTAYFSPTPSGHDNINTSSGFIMIVTIQRATQLIGKSRSTFKYGKLSKTNESIDTSELLRVYGAFVQSGDASKIHQPYQKVQQGKTHCLKNKS
jgi:hypothetical protein